MYKMGTKVKTIPQSKQTLLDVTFNMRTKVKTNKLELLTFRLELSTPDIWLVLTFVRTGIFRM